LEYVRIDREALDAMFEIMEYQSLLIAAMYEKCRLIQSGKWIPTETVAELLCVSTRKVRTMKTLGQLGYVKHGRKCFYKSEDVYSKINKGKSERNI
jgi:hypothetical protein